MELLSWWNPKPRCNTWYLNARCFFSRANFSTDELVDPFLGALGVMISRGGRAGAWEGCCALIWWASISGGW